MTKYDWLQFFPKHIKPRPVQIEAIDKILNAFLCNNKKFVICQATTGSGKSAIAYTVSNFLNDYYDSKSYILTTQLILQEQYKQEFSDLANISSKRNIKCNKYNTTVNEVDWLHKYTKKPKCDDCPYTVLKEDFISNPISVTNTNWFFSNLEYAEYQLINSRNTIVVDEAHNLADNICTFKGMNVNYADLKPYGFSDEYWPDSHNDIFKWVSNVLSRWINSTYDYYEKSIERSKNDENKLKKLIKQVDFLDKLKCQINRVLPTLSKENWVIEHNDFTISIQPLYAKQYSEDCLFRKGKHILLMTGTVLNDEMFAKELGIEQDYEFIDLDHTFPVENRQIFFTKSGKMGNKNIADSLENVISDIDKLLNHHKNEKGIIHTNSHKLAKTIYSVLNNDRLLIIENFKNRDDMLTYHYESTKPTVLISPSLYEGVDLSEDLSRFQIICKVPFANLGSKYVKTKMEKIAGWYNYITAKTMVQSYGRSIRSANDKAVTYILDSDFEWFLKHNRHNFPKYFTEALINKKVNKIIQKKHD